MRSNKRIFILFLSLALCSSFLSANYAFKKKVKDVCKSYRISMESNQLELETDVVSISMKSGRNNFEMFMLVGFASAGQAIAHQKQMGLSNAYIPGMIRVSVDVPVAANVVNVPAPALEPPIVTPSSVPPLMSAVSATRLSILAVPSMYRSFHSESDAPKS